MDTDNYRRCMDVMLLLTFQDSAQFHFGNLVFAPNLYMSAMLFPFVDLLTFPYVEVLLLLAFYHNCAALYLAHCTVQYTAAPKLSSRAAPPCPHWSGVIAKPDLHTFASTDQGTTGNQDQVDTTLLHHPLYHMDEADLRASLYSEHTEASKLRGPDLVTLTSRVQVMLLRTFPYVDVTMLACLHCSVRAHYGVSPLQVSYNVSLILYSVYFMYFFMNYRMLLLVIVPVYEERTLLP